MGTIRTIDTNSGVPSQNAQVERVHRRAGKEREEDLGKPLTKPAFGGPEMLAAGKGEKVVLGVPEGFWRLEVPAVLRAAGHPGRRV